MASDRRSGAKTSPHPSLQISEDMRFQRRSWVAERIAWMVMVAVLIAALLGLFSTGLLSSAEARDEAGLVRVEYQRFLRHLAPTTIRVRIAPDAGASDTVSLRVGRSFARAMQIEQIRPEPQQALTDKDGLILVFRMGEAGGPGLIHFSIKPNEPARIVRGEIGLLGRQPARLTQFIYP